MAQRKAPNMVEMYAVAREFTHSTSVDFRSVLHVARDIHIPIIIDAEHYEKVIKEKGPLTKEEAEKAELYYQAQLNYPTTNFFTTLNPFSKYYDNLLEKEAYKESPCFATRIRKLFGKD